MAALADRFESHEYDVVVLGAGGAGLRAAIAAAAAGCSVALICKSLLGKAHTVMAEGGIAASLGNVDAADTWQVHFADTMRGGQMINDWRMAEIFAKEVPERVYELERWGALFDRTPQGTISQRPFGAHTYRRLCHVGDRTGLELIRTLQDRGVHSGIDVFMEYTTTRLLTDNGRIAGLFGYKREDGRLFLFRAKAVVLATGGFGKVYKVTSNSWESTGDGVAMAYEAGAALRDMEMVQFHPTGMLWPPGVRGILVTEAVRGEGGLLYNAKNERFMLEYDPKKKELSSRDVVARSIYKEVQAGRGSEHGGAYLDVTHRGADYIKRKLPSMYEQFMHLADVDITKERMEVAPTIHYAMGGIDVAAETGATSVTGLYAAGECAAGLHGANRLGGNSLGDILVFGKRAGEAAAGHARSLPAAPTVDDGQVAAEMALLVQPFQSAGQENPYLFHAELQEILGTHAAIARTQELADEGLVKLQRLQARARDLHVEGSRMFNPGWHTARDDLFMLTIGEAILRSAARRTESRGAHWRLDYPEKDPVQERLTYLARKGDDGMLIEARPIPPMPPELAELVKETA
jgi:succinate dehydrogenase / fumarate reductase flavoprotein subunit